MLTQAFTPAAGGNPERTDWRVCFPRYIDIYTTGTNDDQQKGKLLEYTTTTHVTDCERLQDSL